MYTLLIFPGGRMVDALLLSATPECLRLVIPGRAETAELRLIDGKWMAESGAVVEVGALVAGTSAQTRGVWSYAGLPLRAAS